MFSIAIATSVLKVGYVSPARPKIRYVLSLLEEPELVPKVEAEVQKDDFVFKFIQIEDAVNADILFILKDACDWIGEQLKQNDGGVLVHCYGGVSRSASVVVAYYMRETGVDLQEALSYVENRRGCVDPNLGFRKQLELWERLEYDVVDQDGRHKEAYMRWKTEKDVLLMDILEDRNAEDGQSWWTQGVVSASSGGDEGEV